MSSGYDDLEPPPRSGPAGQEVRFEHSPDLAERLREAGIAIFFSTYQAGKLGVLQAAQGKLDLSLHAFERPMGVACDAAGQRLAIATQEAVWHARNHESIARRLSPEVTSSKCFLTHSAHLTGDIQAHEIAWSGEELWVVNTRFSCLCTLSERFSFVPKWRPSFVTSLAAEDRCHLNGLAIAQGESKYVTTLAETNSPEGWRDVKHFAGCLIDVASHEVVVGGLCMPHSPRVRGQEIFVLNSGRGALLRVDPQGRVDEVGRFPGYTRGLAIHKNLAVVGLSKIRESSTFGGVPIAKKAGSLRCGLAVVDLDSGSLLGQFEFRTGIDELFDVAILPCRGHVEFRGPHATQEGRDTIWAMPE